VSNDVDQPSTTRGDVDLLGPRHFRVGAWGVHAGLDLKFPNYLNQPSIEAEQAGAHAREPRRSWHSRRGWCRQ
jgi:hypothetical protein